jgi:histidyl-tRNA synthetase
MKAQMREANRQNTPYALIVGDTELEKEAAVIKNMNTGTQADIPFAKLIAELQQVPGS